MRYLCGALIYLALLPGVSFAATLYIDPGIATVYRGDAITTSIRLMPDQAGGECINAADVVIRYPEAIQPVDVSIGQSIFSVWVEAPKINKETRTITFAGGIPNGYCGRVQGDPGLTNIIAEVIFRSPGLQIGIPEGDGVAVIDFSPETQVYLNDGQGTKAPLLTLPSTLTLEKTAGAGIVDAWREAVRSDDIPPENFSIQLEKDPTGQYYIVAVTTDKQTGISHYEVIEEPLSEFGSFTWGAGDAPWTRIENNYYYVLSDQTLNSTIRVRAYDKAGNEYVATLVPDEALRGVSLNQAYIYTLIGFVSVLVVSMIVILGIYVRRRLIARKSQGNTQHSSESNDVAENETS